MSVEGYYVTCDDALCTDCAPAGFAEGDFSEYAGFEDWTEPIAIFGDTESDSVTHCAECGAIIEHDLTAEGYAAVNEAIREGFAGGIQNPVTVLWIDSFEDYDDDVRDAATFYRLMPRDTEWIERDDLRRYAVLAGWID